MKEVHVYESVRASLRRNPDPAVWEYLMAGNRVRDVLVDEDPEDALQELLKEIRELEELRAAPSAERAPRDRTIPPDGRAQALARILALDAARQPEVVSFRRDVFRGRLLALERVPKWIERQAKRQGRPTMLATVPLDAQDRAPKGRLWPPGRGLARRYELVVLTYPGPDAWTRSLPVNLKSPLGRLVDVAQGLERRYGWRTHESVAFVLTGRPVALPVARITTTGEKALNLFVKQRTTGEPIPLATISGLARIHLDVDPRLRPEEVMRLYREARRELPGRGRSRVLSAKHAELAVFAVEVNDGRTWEEARREWNAKHPKWQYADVRVFNRDAKLAYRRVVGHELRWQNRAGPRRKMERRRERRGRK